jgi:hypothetical protein
VAAAKRPGRHEAERGEGEAGLWERAVSPSVFLELSRAIPNSAGQKPFLGKKEGLIRILPYCYKYGDPARI